jgi:hypothetical protein
VTKKEFQNMNSVDVDDDVDDGGDDELDDEREVTSAESVDLAEIYRNFSHDCEALAKQFIVKFFANRSMHCGGRIPKSVLESPEYVNLVLHTDVCKGVEQAYKLIEDESRRKWHDRVATPNQEMDFSDEPLPEDISKVLGILNVECPRMKVPKALAAGIMLMCLELCEGIGAVKDITPTFSQNEMAMFD